jgi:hypothetical protein
LALAGVAVAYSNSVTYSGQGQHGTRLGGYGLNAESCGEANGR